MGKTYRAEPNPERAARARRLRESGAAGPHKNRNAKTRLDEERAAIAESYEDEIVEISNWWDTVDFDEEEQ